MAQDNSSTNLGPPIITADDSLTAYSPTYHETFHSVQGAQEECEVIFFQASKIQEKWQAQRNNFTPCKMLEVGFGLGLNWQTLQHHWQELAPAGCVPNLVQYHTLEKDTSLIQTTTLKLKLAAQWRQVSPQLGHWFFSQTLGGKTLELFIWPGDARQVISQIEQFLTPCQAVWQDAFSPRHNHELWTWQWFKQVTKICAPDALLVTYSSATPVRLAMQKAGFKVAARAATQSKKSSTIAALEGIDDPQLAAKLAATKLKAYDDND